MVHWLSPYQHLNNVYTDREFDRLLYLTTSRLLVSRHTYCEYSVDVKLRVGSAEATVSAVDVRMRQSSRAVTLLDLAYPATSAS